jgi:hypothetical protein
VIQELSQRAQGQRKGPRHFIGIDFSVTEKKEVIRVFRGNLNVDSRRFLPHYGCFVQKESEKWMSRFPVWRNLIKLQSNNIFFRFRI